MTRHPLIVVALLALVTSCTHGQQPDKVYSKAIEDKISQVETNLCATTSDKAPNMDSNKDSWTLADRMKFYQVEGLSIAVIHNHEIEWARGYGFADVADHRQVTTNTLFQAGSISKSLNAVGVLLLVQRHQLGLNEDINTWLRTWKFPYDPVSGGRRITLGNLLSHTGGLGVHGFPGYEQGETLPGIEDILDGKKPANTAAVRSITEPGRKYIYSGGGTTITQRMVMDVTGLPYDQYMSLNVLQPLAMDHSSYTQPPPASSDRATGYLKSDKEVPGKYHIYPEQAAAGLWTTPTDIGKYIIESQLAFDGKSAKVLDHATTVTRLSPYIDSIADNGVREGLGVFLFQTGPTTGTAAGPTTGTTPGPTTGTAAGPTTGTTAGTTAGVAHWFNHNGSDVGFLSSYYGCLESGDGVVVMINNDINGKLLREVVNSVARVYHWENFKPPF